MSIGITDDYGHDFVISALVAFNYGGEVRLGHLKSVSECTRYGKKSLKFVVTHFKAPHVESVIRNPNAIKMIPGYHDV